jgi:sterol desaturase/sphingolipid hydroxylase (fatty acid hydroxylase superfamily)
MTLHALAIDSARSAVWLALLTLLFVPLERLFAERPQLVLRRQLAADLGYYALNSIGTVALLSVLTGMLATLAWHGLPSVWLGWVDRLGLWPRAVLTLAVSELGSYWGHRWSHEMPWLWRFHAIHHGAQEVDWLTASRGHPVDLIFTRLCGLTLICTTGLVRPDAVAPNVSLLLATVFSIVWGYFIHANLRWRFGWLESVIATPAFHRWHHTNDSWRDRNYASTLPVYDRLFGTFHLPAADMPSVYGIDARLPSGFWRQLIEPLGFSGGGKRASTPASFSADSA